MTFTDTTTAKIIAGVVAIVLIAIIAKLGDHMKISLKKETSTPQRDKICPDCRYYAISWVCFCVGMGGLVLPCIIDMLWKPDNLTGMIVLALCLALSVNLGFLFGRPYVHTEERRAASFTHIHII